VIVCTAGEGRFEERTISLNLRRVAITVLCQQVSRIWSEGASLLLFSKELGNVMPCMSLCCQWSPSTQVIT